MHEITLKDRLRASIDLESRKQMDGMGFLLQSMGIDPEQLKKAAGTVQQTASAFQEQLSRIECKVNLTLERVQSVEMKLNSLLTDLTIESVSDKPDSIVIIEGSKNGRGGNYQN